MLTHPLDSQERADLVAELTTAHEHRACVIRRMLRDDDALREVDRICSDPRRTFQVA